MARMKITVRVREKGTRSGSGGGEEWEDGDYEEEEDCVRETRGGTSAHLKRFQDGSCQLCCTIFYHVVQTSEDENAVGQGGSGGWRE